MNTPVRSRRIHAFQRGFTLLEALSVTMILGVISSMAYLATSSTVQRAHDLKLRSDVATLNRAVEIYVANGGDISTAADSQDIINRLKTQLSAKDAARFVGLTSSMSDMRIETIYQTTKEAATNQLRTTWDPNNGKFVLGNAGGAAIKRFILDPRHSDGESKNETRSHSGGFMYALDDEWIWDFEDRPELSPTQLTMVPIYFVDRGHNGIPPTIKPSDPPVPGPTDPGGDPDPKAPPMLTPPVFSPEGSKYLYTSFPMAVTLASMNPEGTAIIRFALNEGSFQTYSGPISVTHNDTIRAYSATAQPTRYTNSQEVSAKYESVAELFAGQASGAWVGGHRDGEIPVGGDSSTNYNSSAKLRYFDDGSSSIFEWGTPANSEPPNSLRFQGSTIINMEPEQLFRVGQISYYNGAVYSGTEAHTVSLNVHLALTTPARNETFAFKFDLENTPNNGPTADANADYVRMQSRAVPMSANLNGKLYYLVIEFGEVDRNGFSSVNQFHVHENKSASTGIYGYFTQTPPAWMDSYATTHGSGGGSTPTPVTLSVADAGADEGSPLSFAVTLSSPSSTNTVISYSTANGTAISPADYTAKTAQTLTIPAGQTVATITVPTATDGIVELNETLSLNYSVSAGTATAQSSRATGTIRNTNTSVLTIADASANEGGTLTFAVNLSNPVDADTVVTYSTADGTATSSSGDYIGKSNQTITIPAGSTSSTFTVVSVDDATVELNENFYVDYSISASGRQITKAPSSIAGTIVNNDISALSVASVSAEEGNALQFPVVLSNPVDTAILLAYSTQDETATVANNDYSPKINWTLSVAAGQTSGMITVSTTHDDIVELNETLRLVFTLQSSGRAVTQSITHSTGTILNNDNATLSIANANAFEGNPVQFVVTLSRPADVGITVLYSTKDGTATVADNDYTPKTNATLVIPAGQTTGTISIATISDPKKEPDEAFTINYTVQSSGRAVTATGTSAQGTIKKSK